MPAVVLASAADTVDATSKATASFTSTAGRLTLAIIHNTRASSPTLPTVTDAVRTWVQVATTQYDTIAAPTARLTIFRCMVAATGAATFACGGVTQTGFIYFIVEFDEVETGGSNGANAIVQSVTGNIDTATALTLTLATLAGMGNRTFGAIGRANTANDLVPGSGFTGLGTLGHGGPSARAQSQWNINDPTVDWSWGATTRNAGGIAIEIAALPAPPPPELSFSTAQAGSLTPWAEVSRRVASAGYGVQTTYHARIDHTLNDPSTYYGGYKAGDVMDFGDVFRELSDDSGELRDSQASVTCHDADRLWRPLVATDVFKGQPLTIRTIDHTRRKLGTTPKIIARQQMVSPSFTADGSVTFSGRDRIAALLAGVSAGRLLAPQHQITSAHFLEIASDDEYLNQGIPEIYGSHLNTALGYGGPIPLLPIDFPHLINGIEYGLSLAMVGACQSMPALYKNDELVSDSNGYFLRPGGTQWNLYSDLDVGGANVTYYTLPSGLRITPVFTHWFYWPEVKDGRWKLTCTLHGVEDSANGDGTGAVITSGPRQVLHWLNNRVFRQQWTTPYGVLTDPDGTPYLDEQSFLDTETGQIARLAGGYPLRWRVGPDRIAPDEQLARVVCSMGARLGQTWEGSVLLRVFDRAQASTLSITPDGTAAIILQSSLEPSIDDSQHANQITYDWGERYVQSGMEISGASIRDEASIAKYGRIYDSDVLSLPACGSAPVAYDVAYHALKARTEPPHRYSARVSLAGLDAELGRTALITHPFGIQGSTGVVAAPFWIEGIGHDIQSGDVQLVLLDQNHVASSLAITTSVTGITRVGHIATVEHTAHGQTSGRTVTILGANETQYNGSKIVTVTDVDHYTFVVSSAATTPATGTITAGTYDTGRLQIVVENVKEQDHLTRTGPIPAGKQEYALGSLLEAGEIAVDTNFHVLTRRLPQDFEKSAIGDRDVTVRVSCIVNGGTLSVRFVKEGTNTVIGSTETTTSTSDVVVLVIDGIRDDLIEDDDAVEYELQWKMSNTTNRAWIHWAGVVVR